MRRAGPSAAAFCERPQGSARIALIFGGDPGLVSTSADALAHAWLPSPDPFNIVRLGEEDLKRDPRLLADELVARSLLGGERLVRLRLDRETAARPVIELLADIDAGSFTPEAWWIIEAGGLPKTSKLRGAFEASANAVALQLYEDDEAAVSELVTRRLAGAGIAIDAPALAAFVAELPGDRRLALSEIAKLELYAIGLGRAINADDILQLSSAEQPRGADDAADAAILGDVGQAATSINRFLDAGGNPISAMRTLHFRLARVSDAVAQNAGSGARLRPPVYEREWPAFSRALRDFPAPVIRRAFTRLYEAEKSCKQAGAPADAILRNLIHRVATRAI